MREIKFRVLYKLSELQISDQIFDGNTNPRPYQSLGVTELGIGKRELGLMIYDDMVQDVENKESLVFLQYTGVQYKSITEVVEIFEADIVQSGKSIGQIVFQDGCFIIKWIINPEFFNDILKNHAPNLKYLGNAYENPELLEVK